MALPNVVIKLGNGGLGGVVATDDAVVGLLLTGAEVADMLTLNTHYVLSGTADLETYGITAANNPLVYKEVVAFYSVAGEGAELHLVVAAEATTLAEMCAVDAGSPLKVLIDGASGRIRVVGVNKIAPDGYELDVTSEIDADAIAAAAAAHSVAESYAGDVMPFRVLLAAPSWSGATDSLYAPNTASYNRVGFVIGSSGECDGVYPAAIGEALGRVAAIEVHQSIARVKDGAVVPSAYFTDGKAMNEHYAEMAALHAAGYIFFRDYSTKSGGYFNAGCMAAPETDDYSRLHAGRVIDKAAVIAYNTYIEEIKDNLLVEDDGSISKAVCVSLQSMINNAIFSAMGTQISNFESYVNPDQNVLSTGEFSVVCNITPQGVTDAINVTLGFINPSI